jgi:hypothetical protein
MNVKMPRIGDVFFSLMSSCVAVSLFIKAHTVWQEGRVGYASLFVAGGVCAVIMAIIYLMGRFRRDASPGVSL